MGNCQSLFSYRCGSQKRDSLSHSSYCQASATAKEPVSSSTSVLNFAGDTDKDIDPLVAYVKQLLDIVKGSSSNVNARPDVSKWSFTDTSDLSKLKDLLSESAELAADLEKAVSDSVGSDVLKSAAKTALTVVGKAHWAAAGLLVICFVLERFNKISSNRKECIELLEEMLKMATYICKLKKRRKLKLEMQEFLEECIETVVAGSIMCLTRVQSSWWSKFVGASVDAERIKALKEDLGRMYTHLFVEMSICIFDAQQGIQFARQKLFPTHAIGIDDAMKNLVGMLEMSSEKNVVAIIIFGFGGIGKTTLGDAVYASLDTDDFSFSKVTLRDTSASRPVIPKIQKAMLDDISYGKSEYKKVKSDTEGQAMLLEVFQKEACFLYIDNVLEAVELLKLLPRDLYKCKKLRLLITTRDATIRDGLNIEDIDAVKRFDACILKDENAMQLLKTEMGKCAAQFKKEQMDFLIRVSGGVPLCLQMLGRYIRNEADKLKAFRSIELEHKRTGVECFGREDLDFFTFAFNGLQDDYRDAFLDICAFHYSGSDLDFVENLFGEDTIQVLENRALIQRRSREYAMGVVENIEDAVTMHVHDVMLETARKILLEEGKRITSTRHLKSLLEEAKQNQEVFRGIKGIGIQARDDMAKGETVKLPAEILDIMSSSLRIFASSCIVKDQDNDPEGSQKEDEDGDPQNENEAELDDGKEKKVMEVGGGCEAKKVIEVEGECEAMFKKLISWKTPGVEPPRMIMKSPELKRLDYSPTKAIDLSQLPPSLRDLDVELQNMNEDSFPLQLPSGRHRLLRNLSILNVGFSKVLTKIQEAVISKLNSLQTLCIESCPSLQELPEDLHHLPKLKKLDIVNCKSLKSLPKTFGKCTSLKMLTLDGCQALEGLPKGFCNLSSLESFSLDECTGLRNLGEGFEKLSSLKNLFLDGCENLVSLGENFHRLPSLQILDLSRCHKLDENLMDKLIAMKSLKAVYMFESVQLIQRWEEIESENITMKFIY